MSAPRPDRTSRSKGLGLAALACFLSAAVHVGVLMHSFALVGTDVRERRTPDGTRSYQSYSYDGPKVGRPSVNTGVPKGRVVRADAFADRTVTHYVDPVGAWTAWPVPVEAVDRHERLMRFVPLDMILVALAFGLVWLAAPVSPAHTSRTGARATGPVQRVRLRGDGP